MERKLILDFDRKQKSRKSKSNKPPPNKKSKTQLEDEAAPSTSYRDRAKERREGINKDFELDPDDLIISNPIVDGEQCMDEDKRRLQQIEDSKYLGGDVEHTHLVKGLDFALLEKIKTSEPKVDEDRDHLFGAIDSDEEEYTKEAIRAASDTISNRGQLNIDKLRKTDIIKCNTALARNILNALDEKWPEKSQLFLPGRMSYIVPIDEEADSTVTTILRSKSEQMESETSTEKEIAFNKIIDLLAEIRKRLENTSAQQ